jgi:membrane-bound lytic murein transglycosylase D
VKLFCLLMFILLNSSFASRYMPDNKVTERFHIPKGLDRAVDFWIDVYSKYDVDEIIIHDSVHYVVYEVIDISAINALPYFTETIKKELIDSRVSSAQQRYRDILVSLNSNNSENDPLANNIYKKFVNIEEEDKFLNASRPGRIRTQRGHRSNFKEGLHYSGKYIPVMENIFKEYGLPEELVRLPFVESYFNPQAVSSVNAVGIWQFMKGTGREYMKVDHGYDERRDPIVSTHAAAKLLKKSYKYLYNNWPLAVTSYNHGKFGMKRAVNKMNTKDLVKLIKEYKGRNFGYSTKNFYAQFLATLYIEANHKKLFGDTTFARMGEYKFLMTIKPVKISELCFITGLNSEQLKKYNPAISKNLIVKNGVLPKGSRIRIPVDRLNTTLSKLNDKNNHSNKVRLI